MLNNKRKCVIHEIINDIMEKVALRKGVKRALQDLAGKETYAKYIESLRVSDWVLLFF